MVFGRLTCWLLGKMGSGNQDCWLCILRRMGEAFSSTKRTVSLSLTKHKHKQPFVDIYVRTSQVKSKVQMITVCTSNIFPQNDLARGSFP